MKWNKLLGFVLMALPLNVVLVVLFTDLTYYSVMAHALDMFFAISIMVAGYVIAGLGESKSIPGLLMKFQPCGCILCDCGGDYCRGDCGSRQCCQDDCLGKIGGYEYD